MKTIYTFLLLLSITGTLAAQSVPRVEVTRIWTTGSGLNINLENEGFESGLGNFTNSGALNWTTTNTESYEGTMSATSNVVFGGQAATLDLNVEVPSGYTATVKFYMLADTTQGPDMTDDVRIAFAIDGSVQSNTIIPPSWTLKTYFLTEGNHLLKWNVFHNSPASDDQVQAFLDQVVINYNRRPAFRMADGSQGFGKVLMSDANGNASWRTLSEMTEFDNNNGTHLLPLTLDGRHQIQNPLKVIDGNGNGIQSSSNLLNGFTALGNGENGYRASNNGTNGFEALNNNQNGFRALSNDSTGFIAQNNERGFRAVNNTDDGFYADGNGNDGFRSLNNTLNGFYADGNFRGFDSRNSIDDGYIAIYNAGHGFISAGNNAGGFKAEDNADDGFEASGNTGRGFYATMNTGNGFAANNNDGSGMYLTANATDGAIAISNTGNGFKAESNTNDGFRSINNTGDGLFAAGNDNGGYFEQNETGVVILDNDIDGIQSTSNGSYGLYLFGNGNHGIYALLNGGSGIYSYSNDAYGIDVHANDLDGIYSHTNVGDEGYFSGTVTVTGNLSKGGGSFKIDHPLDPENKFLYHSFVESPDMMNVYNGNIVLDTNGEAIVQMDDWFEPLNRDFRYQLTAIGTPGPNLYIAEEINNNRFKIAGGTSGMKVSWQVTGIRQDPYANQNRIEVEVEKPENFRGYYIHPEAYSQGFEKSFDYVKQGHKTLDEMEVERQAEVQLRMRD